MSVNQIELRKMRDFSEIINVTFAFLRENFVQIMKTCIPVALPFVLLGGILTGLSFSKIMSYSTQSYGDQFNTNVVNDVVLMYLGYFFYGIGFLLFALFCYEYIKLYLDHSKQSITWKLIWENSKGKILPLIGLSLMIMIMLMIGFILLIIPGIFLMVPLSFAMIIYLMEGKSVFSSISRSFNLTQGHWWSSFGLIIVLSIIQAAVSMVVAIPFYAVMMFVGINSAKSGVQDPDAIMKSISVIYAFFIPVLYVFSIFSYVIMLSGIAIKYFSIVEEKEGVGLMEKVERMEVNPQGLI